MPVFASTIACVRSPKLGQARPPAPGRGKYPTPLRIGAGAALDVEGEGEGEASSGTHTTVDGYRIGELLGRGGMSAIFSVSHADSHEPLAMKVVTDHRLQDDLAYRAIHAHAKATSFLKSPHVVRTVDAGRLPSGEPFVVIERLDGEDLSVRLARGGALPVAEALRAVLQACDGLAEAHAAGIIHGDIKPGNLVMTTDPFGSPCLKIVDFAPSVPSATDPDDPLVTFSPGYAAPEQMGGRGGVDARADVFALGVVLHELVTGERAFCGTSLSVLLVAMKTPPRAMKSRLDDVPAALDPIVRRCLAYDREARFGSVSELRAALAGLERDAAGEEARRRAATTARSPVAAPLVVRTRRVRRTLLLAALGPASALVSMTLVRALLAMLH